MAYKEHRELKVYKESGRGIKLLHILDYKEIGLRILILISELQLLLSVGMEQFWLQEQI